MPTGKTKKPQVEQETKNVISPTFLNRDSELAIKLNMKTIMVPNTT